MDDLGQTLRDVTDHLTRYRNGLDRSRVGPRATRAEIRTSLATPVPEHGLETRAVVAELIDRATPGLVASAGPRYFGFVVGGSLDAALAADLLTSGWDQVAFNEALSPASLAFEDVAGGWLKELLRIPASSSVGFVTGAQAANTVGLAAARWKVLQDRGWDVGIDGLFGAPRLRVVVGVSVTRRSTGRCGCSASARRRRRWCLPPGRLDGRLGVVGCARKRAVGTDDRRRPIREREHWPRRSPRRRKVCCWPSITRCSSA